MPRIPAPVAVLAAAAALAACGDAAGDPTGGAETPGTDAPISTTDSAGPTAPTSTSGVDTGVDTGDASTEATGAPPPPDLPAATCLPEGGTWWVLEGESIEVPIACASGDDPGLYTLDPQPPGLQLNPTAVSWTPGLDQAATYELTLTVATGETANITIGVIDAFTAPANVPLVEPKNYTHEYGLPVLHLWTTPGISDQGYTSALVVYKGKAYAAGAKYRGAASLGYPKKSYTLEFDADDFDDPDEGFEDKDKIVLISTFDDNTYIRQRLAYEMWNDLDPGHIRIDTYSAVVFLDGAYWGLYTVSDHVDNDLFKAHGLADDGNLYKARTHDANFRLTDVDDNPKDPLHKGLTKEGGAPEDGQPGAYADLEALITFVATASPAEFTAQLDTLIDRRDYEDWWIFVSLCMGDDSAGKNSYHWRDPDGGPWRYAPWDFNDSFGQTWQTARKGYDADPEGYTWTNELFTRLLADPAIGDPLRARYAAALKDVYAVDGVLDRVDELALEVVDSAHRDEQLWAPQYQTYGGWNWRTDFLDHDAEMDYLRQWIADRWAFVAAIYP